MLGTVACLGDAGNLRRLAGPGNGGREAGSGWTWFGDAADQDAQTPTTTDRTDFEIGVTKDRLATLWPCTERRTRRKPVAAFALGVHCQTAVLWRVLVSLSTQGKTRFRDPFPRHLAGFD